MLNLVVVNDYVRLAGYLMFLHETNSLLEYKGNRRLLSYPWAIINFSQIKHMDFTLEKVSVGLLQYSSFRVDMARGQGCHFSIVIAATLGFLS